MSTTKLLLTKEPINKSFAAAFGFFVFSLKVVHMYWNMLGKLI